MIKYFTGVFCYEIEGDTVTMVPFDGQNNPLEMIKVNLHTLLCVVDVFSSVDNIHIGKHSTLITPDLAEFLDRYSIIREGRSIGTWKTNTGYYLPMSVAANTEYYGGKFEDFASDIHSMGG